MMFIVRILKRRDASSVLVAIVVAMTLGEFLTTIISPLSVRISGLSKAQGFGPAAGWKVSYLMPLLNAVLALVALEIVLRLYVYATGMLKRK